MRKNIFGYTKWTEMLTLSSSLLSLAITGWMLWRFNSDLAQVCAEGSTCRQNVSLLKRCPYFRKVVCAGSLELSPY